MKCPIFVSKVICLMVALSGMPSLASEPVKTVSIPDVYEVDPKASVTMGDKVYFYRSLSSKNLVVLDLKTLQLSEQPVIDTVKDLDLGRHPHMEGVLAPNDDYLSYLVVQEHNRLKIVEGTDYATYTQYQGSQRPGMSYRKPGLNILFDSKSWKPLYAQESEESYDFVPGLTVSQDRSELYSFTLRNSKSDPQIMLTRLSLPDLKVVGEVTLSKYADGSENCVRDESNFSETFQNNLPTSKLYGWIYFPGRDAICAVSPATGQATIVQDFSGRLIVPVVKSFFEGGNGVLLYAGNTIHDINIVDKLFYFDQKQVAPGQPTKANLLIDGSALAYTFFDSWMALDKNHIASTHSRTFGRGNYFAPPSVKIVNTDTKTLEGEFVLFKDELSSQFEGAGLVRMQDGTLLAIFRSHGKLKLAYIRF